MSVSLSKLTLTLPLLPDETVMSYSSRLAKLNGSMSLSHFCGDIGVNFRDLVNGRETEIKHIAAISGADKKDLKFNSPRLLSRGTWRFGHEIIESKELTLDKLRVCPQCVLEDEKAYGEYGAAEKRGWIVKSLRICKTHKCILVPVSIDRSPRDYFEFGEIAKLLREIECKKLNSNNQISSCLETYLHRRIHSPERKIWTDEIKFHALARTCEMLGLLLLNGAESKRRASSEADLVLAGNAGFNVLKNGKASLVKALNDIRMSKICTGKYAEDYGIFFQWLYDHRHNPDFDIIRKIVAEYILENYPVKLGRKVLGVPCKRNVVHTIYSASEKFKIGKGVLGTKLAELGLATRDPKTGHSKLINPIHETVIEPIARELASLLYSYDAAKYLGISKSLFLQLSAEGHIRKYFDYKGAKASYGLRDLDSFVSSLSENAINIKEDKPTYILISDAAVALKCYSYKIIGLILKGEINFVGYKNGEKAPSNLFVDYEELFELFCFSSNVGFVKAKAADILGVTAKTIIELLNSGYLAEIQVPARISKRQFAVISRVSLNQFQSQYIALAELSQTLQRGAGPLAIQLGSINIYPIELSMSVRRFYRRTDVREFICSNVEQPN